MNSRILFTPEGHLSYAIGQRIFIQPSPVGILIRSGCAHAPLSLEVQNDEILIRYACGDVRILWESRSGYHKLTLLSLPEDAEQFIFGPYHAPGRDYGEILGASWQEDGAVVCVQSLTPKVEGGIPRPTAHNDTGLDLSVCKSAALKSGSIYLQLSVGDHSREVLQNCTGTIPGYNGSAQAIAAPIPGADGRIPGACIAIAAAENRDRLLDVIHDMELAEGLPHSTFRGKWAKREKAAAAIYLIFGGAGLSARDRIALAEKAGIGCVYLADMLDQWGHFTIHSRNYPGGAREIRALSDQAGLCGLTIGTHTLSNFITTGDAYVTPVPHPRLLVMDKTTLTEDISPEDSCIYLAEETNYLQPSALNALRIGNELITYTSFDPAKKQLSGCTRGAFGTRPAAHRKGDTVSRLWDHDYRTLFPDIVLQKEMAENMARMIRECGISRMSFDGLEGCLYPGAGEYGMNAFVRTVFEHVPGDLVCDASLTGNYLWHAFTYSNWGEPWYDSARRGGMHAERASHQPFFRNNLIAPMMGWYHIFPAMGKFEATSPETMEYMLSRSAAFDAGMAVYLTTDAVRQHGLIEYYMDLIRLWEDFRFRACLPDPLRSQMQEEQSDWHLEKDGDGWKLYPLILRTQDLAYGDRDISTEAGTAFQAQLTENDSAWIPHSSRIMLDLSADGRSEPFRFRIRVGRPGRGKMQDLEIVYEDPEQLNAQGQSVARQKFSFTAQGGDYLEYGLDGALRHYDPNFRLKQSIPGSGRPIRLLERCYMTLNYHTDADDSADYLFTEIRRKAEYSVRPKNS